MECDDKFKNFGESSENTGRWIPQLSTDVLFCADADLKDKIGVCRGDSGGPASRRFFYSSSILQIPSFVVNKIYFIGSMLMAKRGMSWLEQSQEI